MINAPPPASRAVVPSQEVGVNPDVISVVIPAYKSRDSLPLLIRKLDAILNRTGQPFEIIVVDDSSPDDTWECLKVLKEIYPQLKIIRLLRNSGQHNALLCGLSLAKGSIVITMDDDLQNPPEEVPKLIVTIWRSGLTTPSSTQPAATREGN